MSDAIIPGQTPTTFEQLRRTNAHGAEYWSARDLQDHLGYKQWRRFEDAIKRAITSCQQSGNEPSNHFADAGKMVPLGSGSLREVRTAIERIGGTMPENRPQKYTSRKCGND